MFSLRTWQLGVKSLLLHPLRSLLTVLGIFIGVASVIWLLALGAGISVEAQRQIAGLGADNIILRTVKPSTTTTGEFSGAIPYGLTRWDFERLSDTIPGLREAIPIREIRSPFRAGNREMEGRLVGCTPEYATVTRLEVDRGHFLTDAEIDQESNHCVLAAEVAEELFPFDDPLGRSVRVDEDSYVIVGVLHHRGSTAAIGGSLAAQSYMQDIYIPISTLWRRNGDTIRTVQGGSMEFEIVELNQITLRLTQVENVIETADIVKQTLSTHDEMADVDVIVPLELLQQAQTTRFMFMLLMGMMAAISLVVGGIGIMNIMLATVTERTREIGVRRALGARRDDIVRQFLIETLVLAVTGGVLGILGGWLLLPVTSEIRDLLVQWAPQRMASLPEVLREATPQFVPWSYPLAFGISVVVGVVFGLYPAMRAARMDPIEALRYE